MLPVHAALTESLATVGWWSMRMPRANMVAKVSRRGLFHTNTSLGGRWSARGTSRVGGTAGLCVPPVRSAQPQTTTAEHVVVALYPHSSDQRSCFFGSSRDGASNEA
jgi:hypothetical protein